MTLYHIGSDQKAEDVPRLFAKDFRQLRAAVTAEEFNAIITRINELIDEAGAEIATAGWLPGNNWSGTAFHPIYEKAARKNQSLAGKLFGLCVWYAVANRLEDWASGRYQKDGKDIKSRTYFRITR